jgi:hypothetical protein
MKVQATSKFSLTAGHSSQLSPGLEGASRRPASQANDTIRLVSESCFGRDQGRAVLPDIDAAALQADDDILGYLLIGFRSGCGRAKRQVSLDCDAIEIFRRDQALGRALQTQKCDLLRAHVYPDISLSNAVD